MKNYHTNNRREKDRRSGLSVALFTNDRRVRERRAFDLFDFYTDQTYYSRLKTLIRKTISQSSE